MMTMNSTIGMSGSTSCGAISPVPMWRCGLRSFASRPNRLRSRRRHDTPERSAFADGLHGKYHHRLANETLMVNEVYLAIVHRPTSGRGDRIWYRKRWRERSATGSRMALADALDACEKLAQTLQASLARYEPELLGTYRSREAPVLVAARIPGTADQRRMAARAAALGPAQSSAGHLRGCSSAPRPSNTARPAARACGRCSASRSIRPPAWSECTTGCCPRRSPSSLTQSFAFLTKAVGPGTAAAAIQPHGQCRRFRDFAGRRTQGRAGCAHQQRIRHGRSSLLACRCSPMSRSRGVTIRRQRRLKALNDAHRAGAQPPCRYRHAGGARGSWPWKRPFGRSLPGNFPCGRARRRSPRETSPPWRRFTTIPSGARRGNHWGDALSMFITSARSPYHFSLHASDPIDPDGGSRKDTGHTLICGPTGSGKTVFIGFLIAMLEPSGCDSGHLRQGSRTGDSGAGSGRRISAAEERCSHRLQSLAAADHAGKCGISQSLAARAASGRPASARSARAVREAADLDQALHGTLALDPRGASSVAAGGISRSDRSGRPACAARALVRVVPRRLRLGLRQCPGYRGIAIGRPHRSSDST